MTSPFQYIPCGEGTVIGMMDRGLCDTVANRKAAHTMDRKFDPDAVIVLKEGKQPEKQEKGGCPSRRFRVRLEK